MKLTVKERRFVDAHLGPCRGNGTQAAIKAGYAPRSAHVTAARLLKKANVRRAIDARQAKQEQAAIADADELDAICTEIARKVGKGTAIVRIKAVSELNKVKGRHSVNVHHSGTVTLEQILSGSRE